MILRCMCKNIWRAAPKESHKCPLCGRYGKEITSEQARAMNDEQGKTPIQMSGYGVNFMNSDHSGGQVRRAHISGR